MLCASTNQPAGGRCPQPVHVLQSRETQTEGAVTIKLPCKETLMGRRKIDRAGEFNFRDLLQVRLRLFGPLRQGLRVVQQHAPDILNGTHQISGAIKGLYFLAKLIHDAGKRRIINSVGALLIRRRKAQGNPTARYVCHYSQAERGITVADPALTYSKFRCVQKSS